MTEPVPGQTPDPAVAGPQPSQPTQQTEVSTDTPVEVPADAPEPVADVPPVNPQELFGSLSLAAIEADIDRLMNDKMSRLDGMLSGLEELVQKLEGEISQLEPPKDDTPEA